MATQPVPEGYHTLTPFLAIENAAEAIAFYERAFGARERFRMPGPDDTIAHAEIEIGDSVVMVEDASPSMGTKAPPTGGLEGSPTALFIYVEDVDATMERAEKLGATIERPASDQFYGDRDGHIVDPFGHRWTVATHVEDVEPDEMIRRMNEMMGEA
jgi:PhnB protein